jgi:hypothetical protein
MCFGPFAPDTPAMPPPAAIEPPKRAERAPDVAAAQGQNKARQTSGFSAGPGSTFLTGPGGVDATQLALGKNVLLGG